MRWRDLGAEARTLHRQLFIEGGITIDTPDVGGADLAIRARTVIQPDGDVLCMIADEHDYCGDAELQAQHREAVRARAAQLVATVNALSLRFGQLVAVPTGVAAGGVAIVDWGVSGVVVVVTSVGSRWARPATTRLAARRDEPSRLARAAGRWLPWVLAACAFAVGVVTAVHHAWWSIVVGVAIILGARLVAVAMHASIRRRVRRTAPPRAPRRQPARDGGVART